jgi:hypothetical protein
MGGGELRVVPLPGRERRVPLHDRHWTISSIEGAASSSHLASGFPRGANAPVHLRSGRLDRRRGGRPARNRRFACAERRCLPGAQGRIAYAHGHRRLLMPGARSETVVNGQPACTGNDAVNPHRATFSLSGFVYLLRNAQSMYVFSQFTTRESQNKWSVYLEVRTPGERLRRCPRVAAARRTRGSARCTNSIPGFGTTLSAPASTSSRESSAYRSPAIRLKLKSRGSNRGSKAAIAGTVKSVERAHGGH